MTIQQFHREFKVFFDKVDSAAYPEFLDGEIDIYLNEAQARLVKHRYGRNNIFRAGFEQIQKRTDDLKNLVRTRFASISSEPSYQYISDNVYRADLNSLYNDGDLTIPATDNYQFYLKSTAQTCDSVECCTWSKVKLAKHDDISTIAHDPFNKPTKTRPIIFFEDGDIFIWTAKDLSINGFQVTFVAEPVQMNIGTYGETLTECELSPHLHKEILQDAINIALENLSSPRVQTQGPVNTQQTE